MSSSEPTAWDAFGVGVVVGLIAMGLFLLTLNWVGTDGDTKVLDDGTTVVSICDRGMSFCSWYELGGKVDLVLKAKEANE